MDNGASQSARKCAVKNIPGRATPCSRSQSVAMIVIAAEALKRAVSDSSPAKPESRERNPAMMASDESGMMTRLAGREPGENRPKNPMPEEALARNAAQQPAAAPSALRPSQLRK